MTNYEMLVSELSKMYKQGSINGLGMTNVHLFGIKYAKELVGVNLGDLSVAATGKESFKTEIRKGMKLSQFVELKKK